MADGYREVSTVRGRKKSKQSCADKVKVPIIVLQAIAICALAIAITFLAQKITTKHEKVANENNDCQTMEQPIKSKHGMYRYAAMASAGEICSKIGTNILGQRQGSAVDAAVATLLCLGVVNPATAGIGGGFLMTVYDKDKNDTEYKMTSLIARETAPRKATRDMYINGDMSSIEGGSSVAVPGEVKGLYEAWRRYGRIDWKDLVQPAIELSETGSTVSSLLSLCIRYTLEGIKTDTVLRDIFFKSDGSPLKEGDVYRNPKLTTTLRRIASDPESFYTGTLAEEISQDILDHGGLVTVDDLKSYTAVWKDPVSVHLDNGNFTMYGPPPPSSAVVLQLILNILDGYSLSESNFKDTNSKVLTYHRLAESLKFGFGQRSLLGDEDYVDVSKLIANLTNDSFASQLRHRILDSTTQDWKNYDCHFEILDDSGTSHLSILAPDGSAVSLTSSLNYCFGARRAGSRTGIVFNDQMDDFSSPNTTNLHNLAPSAANFIAPGKRPMSSMSPCITLNKHGKVVLILGASGGTKIISAAAQVAMHNLWLGTNLAKAIDMLLIHHQLIPDVLTHEPDFPKNLLDGLKAKGHNLEEEMSLAACEGVSTMCPDCAVDYCPDVCIMAANDFRRKDGGTDGF